MRLKKIVSGVEFTVFIDLTNYETHFTPSGDMVLDFTATDIVPDTWFRVEDTQSVNTLIGVISHARDDLLMSRTPNVIWIKGESKTVTNDSGSYARVTVTEWRYPA